MKFGIENYIFNAPLSLICSILLFTGTIQLGNYIFNFKHVKIVFNDVVDKNFVSPILGSSFLILFISPFVLLGVAKLIYFKIIGLTLILLSFVIIKKFLINFKKYKNIKLPLIFLFSYFILCFSPITSGDSLDYHTEVSIHIINYGSFPIDHFWFHSRQAGFGEILISLGLANGAEQYGSFIQFTGLLSIFGIINKQLKRKKIFNKDFLLFALLSSPVLIFLISTNKPQLMSSGLIALAFYITFFNFRDYQDIKIKYAAFLIINILLILAYHIKFSSTVSIFLIWVILIFEIYKSNLNLKILTLIISVLGISLVFPYLHWKYLNFGGSYFQNFFYALPINLHGYSNLWESVSSCGYYCGFPIWFFFPQSLSQATQTIGISSLLIILSIFLKNFDLRVKIIVISYLAIFLFFGQHNARFFIDPFFWTLIALSKNLKSLKFIEKMKIIRIPIYIQSLLTFGIIIVGISTLSIGGINENLRKSVLNKFGYNYQLINWTNKKLKSDAVLLTFGSKNAYLKVKNLSLFFLNYSFYNDPKTMYYLNQIAKKKPTHILVVEPTDNKNKQFIDNCLETLVAEDDAIGSYSGRNPFKINKQKYNAKIYKIKSDVFPECLKINSTGN